VPKPNNRLADQTPVSADLSLEYESSRRLSVGASIRYTAGFTSRATPFLSDYSGATQSLDFYSTWRINAVSRIRFTFENLLHRNEVSATLYADPASVSSRFTTGDPGDKASLSFETAI
jgi:hypothetical protein